jgi:hypothetical protein
MNAQLSSRRKASSSVTLGLLSALALSADALHAEVVIQNDSFDGSSSVTICECFIPDDQVAAWLTAPCNGDIVAVQVLWRSFPPTGSTTNEKSLSILSGGTFPVPGPVLPNVGPGGSEPAVIVAPSLTEGTAFNTFEFLDSAMTKPMSVPVTCNQNFVVALEYLNNTSGGSFADVVWDHDGCQSGRNAVFDSTGGQWADACLLGVTGDWVIRAIIECSAICPAQTTWAGFIAVLVILSATTIGLRTRRARA